jgi:hypothetical protein
MKWAIWSTIWLGALPLAAHSLSMSTGDLRVNGSRATFELRMPMYEVAHVAHPEKALLEAIRFRSDGDEAKLVNSECHRDSATDNYVCTAEYEFSRPVDTISAECHLAKVTVSNHVHLLRAYKDGKEDQAVFDASFEKAELRFRPPSQLESAVREMWRGLSKGLLLLLAIAAAARSAKHLAAMTLVFLAAEAVAPYLRFGLREAFLESAVALTVAYLAVEVLWFADSKARWVVAALGGLFHGMQPVPSVWKLEAVEAVLILLAWFAVRRIHRIAAAILLAAGIAWFIWTIALPR